MKTLDKNKQLFKILCSAAWIDGEIQQEERQYLHKMAEQHQLGEDPEIRALLSEAVQTKPDECYRLVEEYVGDQATEAEYQELIDAVSKLVYSDSVIDTEEAKLLHKIQALEPEVKNGKSPLQQVLKSIQKMYRGAIAELDSD
ncbi:TerB family tellurite resistance protein [[Limnothrix rosea] IAM M-220]|uniref:tellurite resistance TerB family protein n=1 Tax=[Limnothrix rosea] IAM M-220 TaxID=454133 RepID=UPI00095CF58C|nr:TerB family tellurite resistance protein [[Limnothrix rosea] IAM M-220]OKH18452.1 Tellurite resistance protein TerB [[Limnothrix rosea] IAM M-220]